MMYALCLKIATEAHEGQRRWNGDPYITHPIRVAGNFVNEGLRCIAVLHDVIEDTDETVESLINKGVGNEIIFAVNILTKKEDQDYTEYIEKVKFHGISKVVKQADLKDNLSDLKKGNLRDKYMLAQKYLLY